MLDVLRYPVYGPDQIVTKADGQRVLPIMIGSQSRELRMTRVADGKIEIAILNILGDTALTCEAARELAERLRPLEFDVLVTAEAKSIPLAHEVAEQTDKPYVVLRKSYKPYMGEAIRSETLSITTGQPQTLWLDEKDFSLIGGKKVMVLDDVISTGSTLQGMTHIVEQAGGQLVGAAAIFTEGEKARQRGYIALGNLPVVPVKS